jgi:hypothetical protein
MDNRSHGNVECGQAISPQASPGGNDLHPQARRPESTYSPGTRGGTEKSHSHSPGTTAWPTATYGSVTRSSESPTSPQDGNSGLQAPGLELGAWKSNGQLQKK